MSSKFIWRSLAHPLPALCLMVMMLVPSLRAGAQEVRGVVTGRVTDPSGAIVPQVEVDVTAVDTGVQTKVKTNGDGVYEVPFLLPGVYTVTARGAGFTPTERTGVRIDAGARVTVDLQMHMGTTSASVEVTVDSSLMETTNSNLSQTIPREVVTDVASSIYRKTANFVRLAPGVTGQSQGTYTSDNQTAIRINGGDSGRQ